MSLNPDTSTAAIEIEGLYAAYQRKPVLENIDLVFPAGQWTTIVGPNGAGKSTLFHVLTGSMKPLRGRVHAFGQPIAEHRRAGQIAYMAQREAIEWDFPVSVWGDSNGRPLRPYAPGCLVAALSARALVSPTSQ